MTVGPSIYWYLTRSTGAVALVLLTAAVLVGIASIGRLRGPGLPRFVVDGVHRTVALLAVVFLVIHVITAVMDSFVSISLVNAVIPFSGSYRPFWLGLGAAAFDLMVAVLVTSLLRVRVGHERWRRIHWLAYLSWPIAVVHGFGTGSDAQQSWMLLIDVVCILSVLGAVVVRALIGWPDNAGLRIGALSAAGVFAIGLLLWLPAGPLGKGWAQRSGTPPALLSTAHGSRA